VNTESLVEIL